MHDGPVAVICGSGTDSRHDMTYSVLKVPLNPNQPTNQLARLTTAVRIMMAVAWTWPRSCR